jgi:ribulose-5-phosphate 4-epimerase/fuculose-1-phosphate aldolase
MDSRVDPGQTANVDELKEMFLTACRILAVEGLADAAFNISCRFNGNQMMINPVTSPTLVTKENIRVHSLDETPAMGQLHPELYKARPDINGIVHVHPFHCIAFSTLSREYKPVHHYGSQFYGKQLAIHRSPGQVKTKARGEDIAKTLGKGRAILQQGHGATVVGKDLQEALLGAIYLEEAMRMDYVTHQMGQPDYLSEEEATMITGQIYKQRSQDKAWNHYVDKVRIQTGWVGRSKDRKDIFG